MNNVQFGNICSPLRIMSWDLTIAKQNYVMKITFINIFFILKQHQPEQLLPLSLLCFLLLCQSQRLCLC